jgi:hypothetical protein
MSEGEEMVTSTPGRGSPSGVVTVPSIAPVSLDCENPKEHTIVNMRTEIKDILPSLFILPP